jgi:hypothetical protein
MQKKNFYFHINTMIKYLNKKEEKKKRAYLYIIICAMLSKQHQKITNEQQSFDQMMSKGFVVLCFFLLRN